MRNYEQEVQKRVEFIRARLADSGARGIVLGASGGKDSALTAILCKRACENVLGVIMPCDSAVNLNEDMTDALAVAKKYDIEHITVDLTSMKLDLCGKAEAAGESLNTAAVINIAPRLRMTALYLLAHCRQSLVAGTGNRSELYMSYFTKWGDGACDFNPIADLTVREVYEFLEYLDAPVSIIKKAPSAGLFAGQTDEQELGISYVVIDEYLLRGESAEKNVVVIEKAHRAGAHKRSMPIFYKGE